jgi:hypothetical protein
MDKTYYEVWKKVGHYGIGKDPKNDDADVDQRLEYIQRGVASLYEAYSPMLVWDLVRDDGDKNVGMMESS